MLLGVHQMFKNMIQLPKPMMLGLGDTGFSIIAIGVWMISIDAANTFSFSFRDFLWTIIVRGARECVVPDLLRKWVEYLYYLNRKED